MTPRFLIEDLVAQDPSGVTFRAVDRETDRMVALRRFFPFGADGGGLHPEEQTAYRIAVGRLAGIHHTALRTVVGGGCDEVDGMPFIATEWVDGESLDIVMAGEPLPVDVATLLISQALEGSELLSHVFGEEAVWVETSLNTIIVSNKETGRGFTFSIAPLKWLGTGESRGLEAIVDLAENVMGWQGRVINDQAGRGLGGWIKWLRSVATTTSLHEAREMLAASVGDEPPAPAKALVAQATRPIKPVKMPSTKGPLILTLSLIVITGSVLAWFLAKQQSAAPKGMVTTSLVPIPAPSETKTPPPKPTPTPPAPAVQTPEEPAVESPKTPPPSPSAQPQVAVASDPVALANQRAADLAKKAEQARNATKVQEVKKAVDLEAQKAEVTAKGGMFTTNHRELLLQKRNGEAIVLEGTLNGIDYSQARNWMYLLFDGPPGNLNPRGRVIIASSPDLTEESMKPFMGKKIRISGTLEKQGAGGGNWRPLIHLENRASVQVAP